MSTADKPPKTIRTSHPQFRSNKNNRLSPLFNRQRSLEIRFPSNHLLEIPSRSQMAQCLNTRKIRLHSRR